MKFIQSNLKPNTWRVISIGYYGDGDQCYVFNTEFSDKNEAMKAAFIHNELRYHESVNEALEYFSKEVKHDFTITEDDIPFGHDFESTPSIDYVFVLHSNKLGNTRVLKVK